MTHIWVRAEQRPNEDRVGLTPEGAKALIEAEVKRIIDEGYATAYRIIEENTEAFERLAQGLLEYETLTGEEIRRVMRGEPPFASDDDDDASDAGNAPSVTAIPKTKPKKQPPEGGMEPEPTT